MREAILLEDIHLGNEPPERRVIPAGTMLVVEHDYGDTLDVVAWKGEGREEVFWVRVKEIRQIA